MRRTNRRDNTGRTYRTTMQTRAPGRRRRRKLNWKGIAVLACIVVLAISLIRLIGYGISSIQRRNTNQELQAIHSQLASATDAPAAVPAPTQAPATDAPAPVETPVPQPVQAVDPSTPAPYGKIMPRTPGPGEATATPKPTFQYVATNKDYMPEMRALYWKNKDVVAWLNIPGVVDLPVVYRDNVYYLTHDFNGKESNGGTLFLDVMHPFKENTQHLVVHGHNMKDGSMFAHLTHYQQKKYARDHATINWSTMYRKETYELFCVSVISTDYYDSRYVDYLGTATFRSADQLKAMLEKLQRNAVYWRGVEIKPTDSLLTLSTCLDEDRILLVARRVNP